MCPRFGRLLYNTYSVRSSKARPTMLASTNYTQMSMREFNLIESVGVAEILITRVLLTNQSLQPRSRGGIFFVQSVR